MESWAPPYTPMLHTSPSSSVGCTEGPKHPPNTRTPLPPRRGSPVSPPRSPPPSPTWVPGPAGAGSRRAGSSLSAMGGPAGAAGGRGVPINVPIVPARTEAPFFPLRGRGPFPDAWVPPGVSGGFLGSRWSLPPPAPAGFRSGPSPCAGPSFCPSNPELVSVPIPVTPNWSRYSVLIPLLVLLSRECPSFRPRMPQPLRPNSHPVMPVLVPVPVAVTPN